MCEWIRQAPEMTRTGSRLSALDSRYQDEANALSPVEIYGGVVEMPMGTKTRHFSAIWNVPRIYSCLGKCLEKPLQNHNVEAVWSVLRRYKPIFFGVKMKIYVN